MRLHLRFAACCALLVCLLSTACDYPEQGFFLLSGMDGAGNLVASHVFEIKELVDDTDLTYGFTIHVYDPATKTVVDLPFDNTPDFERRGWLFSLSDSDYGQGDLALDLTHSDAMSFVGAWRGRRGGQAWPLAGEVTAPDEAGKSALRFALPLPSGGGITAYSVEPLSAKQVAAKLGKLKDYQHIKGSAPEALDPELGRYALAQRTAQSGQATGGPIEEKPRYTPPPLGGKGGP